MAGALLTTVPNKAHAVDAPIARLFESLRLGRRAPDVHRSASGVHRNALVISAIRVKRVLMKKTAQRSTLTFTVLIAFLATIITATSQDPPRSGTYQIQSGIYREVGGFGGIYAVRLPDSYQAFVSLTIDPGVGVAELAFVGRNQQAVFRRLTNGIVSGNTIQFQYATTYPYFPTAPAQVDYKITNAAGRLWISGSITSTTPTPDFPNLLEHQAVSATFVPGLSINVGSEVELRWSSASNQNYQMQCLSDPTQPGWTNLGGLMPGNGTTNWAVDVVAPVQSQRFYRILTLP